MRLHIIAEIPTAKKIFVISSVRIPGYSTQKWSLILKQVCKKFVLISAEKNRNKCIRKLRPLNIFRFFCQSIFFSYNNGA